MAHANADYQHDADEHCTVNQHSVCWHIRHGDADTVESIAHAVRNRWGRLSKRTKMPNAKPPRTKAHDRHVPSLNVRSVLNWIASCDRHHAGNLKALANFHHLVVKRFGE